ncbi:hypothetical protein LCGC14_2405440, partial [marine sediment metagenome]
MEIAMSLGWTENKQLAKWVSHQR